MIPRYYVIYQGRWRVRPLAYFNSDAPNKPCILELPWFRNYTEAFELATFMNRPANLSRKE